MQRWNKEICFDISVLLIKNLYDKFLNIVPYPKTAWSMVHGFINSELGWSKGLFNVIEERPLKQKKQIY